MDDEPTLPFATFWNWLGHHPDCIVRAGTPEAVIYDDEDLHWSFIQETPETLVVQVLRGKLLVGELLIAPDQIAYVVAGPGEHDDEHVFELITETERDNFASYFFVMVHGYDAQGEPAAGRVH